MAEDAPLSPLVRERFEQLLHCYTELTRLQFPHLQRRLEPGGDFPIGVVVAVGENGNLTQWSIVRRMESAPRVRGVRSGSASAPDNEVVREQWGLGCPTSVWRLVSDAMRIESGAYARELVTQQIEEFFRDGGLVESWHLTYQRAWQNLRALATSPFRNHPTILSLDLSQPITAAAFRRAAVQFLVTVGRLGPDAADAAPETVTIDRNIVGGPGGSANLAELDFDLQRLDQLGHTVDGPFLPEPDLDYEEAFAQNGGQAHFIWGSYSDKQLALAAERSWTFRLAAYREMAEMNFPLQCERMKLYRSLPVEVTVKIDRTKKSHHWHESNWQWYAMRPLAGPRDPMRPSRIQVEVFSGPPETWDAERKRVQSLLAFGPGVECPILAGSGAVTAFFDTSDWRNDVLKQLRQDFLAVWGPRGPV